MRRVLMLSYQFPPLGGSGVQRIAKFAKYLPRYGWQTCILSKDVRQVPSSLSDESLLDEIAPETVVTRVTMEGLPRQIQRRIDWLKKRLWGRVIARLTLVPDTDALWGRALRREALRLVSQHHFDAIYTTDPPSCHLAGRWLKKRTGLPWVMDIRDLWTGNFTSRPASYLHGVLDSRLERQLIASADAVSCVTHGFKRELTRTDVSSSPSRFHVIPNGYDEDDFDEQCHSRRVKKFTLAYVGTMHDRWVRERPSGWKMLLEPLVSGDGPAQMMRTPRYLLRAVAELMAEIPGFSEATRVIFVGHLPSEHAELVGRMGLQDVVEATGYVPHR